MPLKIFSKKSRSPGGKNDSTSPHSFLCLMLVEDRVQAAMWRVEDKKIKLVSQSVIHRYENNEDGLIKIDEALQELGADSEDLSDVVFGFDPKWVGDNGLKKTHKAFIKNLTQSLQLAPMGFVVVTDALAQQLIDDSPLDSSVVVYIQDKHVHILLLKQGKLVNSINVGRSDNIVNDVVEGLARFKRSSAGKDAYLPAKVILASLTMGQEELIETQQAVLGYDWADNHPFLQTPVIEILEPVKLLQAVVHQGGAAVSKSRGLEIKNGDSPAGAESDLDLGKENAVKTAQDFGFEEIPVKGDNFGSAATSFGIPMTEDKLLDSNSENIKPVREVIHEEKQAKNKRPKRKKKFRNKRQMKSSKMRMWIQNHPHKNMIFGGAVVGVLSLMATFIFGTLNTYQAKLMITPDQQTISKEVAIILDSKVSQSNPDKLILKATIEEKEVSGTDSLETTGVKQVGERAAGTITIFNKTTSEKTFAKGASFSAEGRGFTLNEEIKVASASVQQTSGGETKEYGIGEAVVTASVIGGEGNLTKDMELKAASYDINTYSATVKDSFTGGASREIRVVAQADLNTLLKTLKQELIKKGEEEFASESGNGKYYAVTGDSIVILSEFASDIGEETDDLTLDLVMGIEAVSYQSEDLLPLAMAALSEDIPDGYELVDEQPEILSSPNEDATSSTKVVLDANLRAKAVPKLNLEEIVKDILGLSLEEVVGRLQQKDTIKKVEYKLKPAYASWFIKKIPNESERVEVEIVKN